MQTRKINFVSVFVICVLTTACNDSAKETKAPELVDIQGTEQINGKLFESTHEISLGQVELIEDAGKEALEQLSEADRQALIDLTIEESSEVISEDATKMVELLEDINGITD